MIESVSNVSPTKKFEAMEKVSQEQLQSHGSYYRDDFMPPPRYVEPEPRDSGFLGFLGKVLLAAGIAGAVVVASRRYMPELNRVDITKELSKDAKPMEKFKYDFARFADWLEKNTIGLFKKDKNLKPANGTSAANDANKAAEPKS